MNKTIQHEISGIQCDSCDWKDMSIQSDDYEEWINKPCPECGANLLTQADYNMTMAFKKAAEMVNTLTVDEMETLNVRFLENASNDQINDMIDMVADVGNIGDGDTELNIDVTHKDGKIKFKKSDDE